MTPKPRPRVLPGDEAEAAGVDWQAWDAITADACVTPTDTTRRPGHFHTLRREVVDSVFGGEGELVKADRLRARLLVRGAGMVEVLDVEGMPRFEGEGAWGPAGGGWRRCGRV